jgi:hypothetical protein
MAADFYQALTNGSYMRTTADELWTADTWHSNWTNHSFVRYRYMYLNITHHLFHYIPVSKDTWVGRDSSVGIATRCGLDGPGIESR